MNGASALDCENTRSSPNRMNTTTMGANQYFFSCLRNCRRSPKTRALLMRSFASSVVERDSSTSVHSRIVAMIAVTTWIRRPTGGLATPPVERIFSRDAPDDADGRKHDRKEQ